jgi:hypothetical protein
MYIRIIAATVYLSILRPRSANTGEKQKAEMLMKYSLEDSHLSVSLLLLPFIMQPQLIMQSNPYIASSSILFNSSTFIP